MLKIIYLEKLLMQIFPESGGEVVIAERAEITVRTGEKFLVVHRVGEAQVIKVEHVVHSEEFPQSLLLPLPPLLEAVELTLDLLEGAEARRKDLGLTPHTDDLPPVLTGLAHLASQL